MSDAVFLPVSWLFGLIGFNTTDVVGGALHQCLDQGVGLFLREGGRQRGRMCQCSVFTGRFCWIHVGDHRNQTNKIWKHKGLWVQLLHIGSRKLKPINSSVRLKIKLKQSLKSSRVSGRISLSLTLILLLAVLGRPRFSASRFSGNSPWMNWLDTNTAQPWGHHEVIAAVWCHVTVTYNSLLCISSMMSLNSTSLFRSQNPLTSYDTCDGQTNSGWYYKCTANVDELYLCRKIWLVHI